MTSPRKSATQASSPPAPAQTNKGMRCSSRGCTNRADGAASQRLSASARR
eukprot:CAMPEP_0180641860 /NCGR_PEP_ID=MMETSP1037_2-20121125/46793_1 /TAXON_ID=632150 /ORGANISM="Azadinium spinosum, Strain 3D9" /LENGTH=49 /DNA_ID= /DNA_START= /DNA_END= /DNA_ORIENTATION=